MTDEQARLEACPPSDMTMLGLIRHMSQVERPPPAGRRRDWPHLFR
jgi:hypothetical protein